MSEKCQIRTNPGLAPIRLVQGEQTKRGANIAQSGICYLTGSRSAVPDDLQNIAGITSDRAATVSDRREKCLQHVIQTFLHNAVAQTAADIAGLQILNRNVIFVERIQVREDHVASDATWVGCLYMVWISEHTPDSLTYFIGRGR